MKKEFLSVGEAAELLCVSVGTLYNWVSEGKVPFRKHGRRVVFSTSDLEKWSEKSTKANS